MKIAFVRMKYTPFGGAERYLDLLLRELLRRGHEVHLITYQWNPQRQTAKSLIVHHVSIIRALSFLKVLSFAYNAKRILSKGHFDLIHSFERVSYFHLYRAGDGCHKAWLNHRKIQGNFLGNCLTPLNPLHRSLLFLEKKIFNKDGKGIILCNSNLVKGEIQRYYGVPETKLRVLHNGVDLIRFQPDLRERFRSKLRGEYGIHEEEMVLLFVGSGFERKGLPALIRSLPMIQDRIKQPLRVLVVGKGKIGKYETLAKRLGCRERILFLGPVMDPLPWYGVADLFVLPTLYDPFSNATLEALACGIPVITTQFNGASEVMEGEGCGVVLEDSLDRNALASAVQKLSEEKERQKSAKRAREVAMRYSMEDYVKNTLSLYNEIAQSPGSYS